MACLGRIGGAQAGARACVVGPALSKAKGAGLHRQERRRRPRIVRLARQEKKPVGLSCRRGFRVHVIAPYGREAEAARHFVGCIMPDVILPDLEWLLWLQTELSKLKPPFSEFPPHPVRNPLPRYFDYKGRHLRSPDYPFSDNVRRVKMAMTIACPIRFIVRRCTLDELIERGGTVQEIYDSMPHGVHSESHIAWLTSHGVPDASWYTCPYVPDEDIEIATELSAGEEYDLAEDEACLIVERGQGVEVQSVPDELDFALKELCKWLKESGDELGRPKETVCYLELLGHGLDLVTPSEFDRARQDLERLIEMVKLELAQTMPEPRVPAKIVDASHRAEAVEAAILDPPAPADAGPAGAAPIPAEADPPAPADAETAGVPFTPADLERFRPVVERIVERVLNRSEEAAKTQGRAEAREELAPSAVTAPADPGDRKAPLEQRNAPALVLQPNDVKILRALAKAGTTLDQYAIETNAELSKPTIIGHLKQLRAAGLTHRPHGERKGEAITDAGRKALATADGALH